VGKNFFEMNNAEIWDNIFLENEWGKYPSVSVIKFVAKNFYNVKSRIDTKLLEIGSGPGANLWYMAREGFSVYGIDFSKTASDRAIKRLKEEDLIDRIGNGKLLVGDYEEIIPELENGFFDAVIDVESLSCNTFEKSKKIIELCLEKLKPGGKMFSQTFNVNTWGFKESLEAGYHGCYPDEGPLASKGYARYTTRADIDKLYKTDCSTIDNIERQVLYLNNGKAISEWLIEIEKI